MKSSIDTPKKNLAFRVTRCDLCEEEATQVYYLVGKKPVKESPIACRCDKHAFWELKTPSPGSSAPHSSKSTKNQ
jgi:hypothetical protein